MNDIVVLKEHRVTIMKDTTLVFPQLWMDVFISGPVSDAIGFSQMFTKAKSVKADCPDSADLVVFTGGADVNPALYSETRHETTHFDQERDKEEIELFHYCKDKGIPMFGVCRGAQFLHVMNGGKLFQHIDGHMGDHPIWDVRRKTLINRVSSVHHQSVKHNPKGGQVVLADSNKSTKRYRNAGTFETGNNGDIEAYFYADTLCLGVQGHPEYAGYNQFMQWCLEQINELILLNPETELEVTLGGGKCRRLKKSIRDERNAQEAAELAKTVENV